MSNQDTSRGWHDAWRTLLATVIGAVLAAGGGIAGQYYASQFQFSSQVKLSERQDKRRAYADLMGLKALLRQLIVSRTEAALLVDYYYARWKLSGCTKGRIRASGGNKQRSKG